MGPFAAIAGAETAPTGEFGRHVFDIAALLRVSDIPYNYRVLVVGVMGIKLVTPSLFERKTTTKNVFPPWQSATRLQRLRPGTKRSCLIALDAASLTEACRVFLMEARAILARAGLRNWHKANLGP
jgi:hypothetical protein